MSAQFTSLHPYVSQRLLSLFETLAKKHTRLEAKIHSQAQTTTSDNSTCTVNITVNGNAVSSENQSANTDLVSYKIFRV